MYNQILYQFYDKSNVKEFTFLDIPEEGFMFTEDPGMIDIVYRKYSKKE